MGRPVTAIAIFSDANRKFHPTAYEYNYLGTKCTFQFNTYKIIDQDEEALAANDNPFAIVVLTVLLALKAKKLADGDLYKLKHALAKNLLRQRIPKKKISDLLIFLRQYVKFADPKFNAKFDKAIEVLTENNNTMGIKELVLYKAKKEGIEVGREEGKTEVVKNLLAVKKFTIAEIANFSGVAETFVRKVKKSLK